MQLINAQVLGQMTLSDTYTLNPASREFVALSQRAVHGAGLGTEGAAIGEKTEKGEKNTNSTPTADVTLPVLET